jgi:hypothetical protein
MVTGRVGFRVIVMRRVSLLAASDSSTFNFRVAELVKSFDVPILE